MNDFDSPEPGPSGDLSRRARIVLPALAAALVLAVVTLLALQVHETVRGWGRRIGYLPSVSENGVTIRAVQPELPAGRAGLKAGDRIVAIDGRPIRHDQDYDLAADDFQRGQPVAMEVERNGRRLELKVVPGVRPDWAFLLLNAVTACAYLAVALLALVQWRRDPRIRLLFAYTATLALEIASPTLILGRPFLGPIAASLLYLLNGFEFSFHYHLALSLPEPHPWIRRHRWPLPALYTLGIGTALFFTFCRLSPLVFQRQVVPFVAADIERLTGSVILPIWSIGIIVILAHQALIQASPRKREQAGLVLAGTLPWMLYLVGAEVWLGWVGPLADWTTSLETVVLLLPSLAFLVAIARYRLFNLQILARRSLIYSTLTAAVLLLFYGALGTASALAARMLDQRRSIWAASLATLALGLVFSPLRQLVQGAIEKRFFPEREELRQRLVHLASELSSHGNLPKMGRHLLAELTSIFATRSVGLLISSPETGHLSLLGSTEGEPDTGVLLQQSDPAIVRLRRARRPLAAGLLLRFSPSLAAALPGIDPRGLVVPLHNLDRLVGVLAIGRKLDRGSYNSEEIDLLNLLAHHLAVVLENARLTESATYDSLTGLLRREAAFDQLDRELDRARRHHRPLAVAMADLDHFKSINDRFGHLTGDLILKRVARLLSSTLRTTDFVGRYGGEEFILILPETDLRGAGIAAEKIRQAVAEAGMQTDDGTVIQTTLSIGVSTFEEVARRHNGSVDVETLVATADRALYAAKHAGRNRVHPFIHVA